MIVFNGPVPSTVSVAASNPGIGYPWVKLDVMVDMKSHRFSVDESWETSIAGHSFLVARNGDTDCKEMILHVL